MSTGSNARNAQTQGGQAIDLFDLQQVGNQYLTFTLGGEIFAVGIEHVREIATFDNATTVPRMPDFIRGVANIRGEIVPTVDLRTRFKLDPAPSHDEELMLIISLAGEETERLIGALVDDVLDVERIEPSKVQPCEQFESVIDARYLQGVVARDDDTIIIIDPHRLFSVSELAQLDSLTEDEQVNS